jgi:hypothetical protein
VSIQTKQASGVVNGQGFASCLRGRGLNFDELRRGCVSPRTSALLQLRQSLATLHSQAENIKNPSLAHYDHSTPFTRRISHDESDSAPPVPRVKAAAGIGPEPANADPGR